MANDNVFKLFLDNATIAGAGRALYDQYVDRSDGLALSHLVTAALMCDEICIDGSSRKVSFEFMDRNDGQRKKSTPINVVWTWENRFPAIYELCKITDEFLQFKHHFPEKVVVEYILSALSNFKDEDFESFDMNLIPTMYLSKDYFDLDWMLKLKKEVEATAEYNISDTAFKLLLYAWRGVYYHEVSKVTGTTYFPNPMRTHFIDRLLLPGKAIFEYDSAALSVLGKIISQPKYKLIQNLALKKEREYGLSLPPFMEYVLSKCKDNRLNIIENTMILRETKGFQQLRSWVFEYDQALRQGNLLKLKAMKREIENSIQNFEKRHSIQGMKMSVIPKLPFSLLSIKGIEEIGSFKVPGFLFIELFQKPHLSMIWDVAVSTLRRKHHASDISKLTPIPSHCTPQPIEWISTRILGKVCFKGQEQPVSSRNLSHGWELGSNLHLGSEVGLENYEELKSASWRPAKRTWLYKDVGFIGGLPNVP